MDWRDEEIEPISEDEEAPAMASPDLHSTRKILVKLKLSMKTEVDAAGAQPPPPQPQEKKHFCKECNKGFASGKALGGHMSSAHVQANKDYSDRKLNPKTKRPFKSSGTGEITCKICGKGFRSEKSLFGHMRCHPERCYRGMEPPPPLAPSPPPTSSEDDDSGSPGRDLKSWPPGIKRGRGPLGTLIRASEENNALASVQEIVKMVGNGPLKKARPGRDVGPIGDEGKYEDSDDERVKTAVEVLKHMKSEKHVCDLCNKGFSTYQALGGHRSSHTKLKLSIADDDENDYNNRSGKVVIGFDLNMMPEEEEEEEEN